jgi:hypothetical protein
MPKNRWSKYIYGKCSKSDMVYQARRGRRGEELYLTSGMVGRGGEETIPCIGDGGGLYLILATYIRYGREGNYPLYQVWWGGDNLLHEVR